MSKLFFRLYILIALTIIGYNLITEYILDAVIAPTVQSDRLKDVGGLLSSLDELARLNPPAIDSAYWKKLLKKINHSSNFPVELGLTNFYSKSYPDAKGQFESAQNYFVDIETYELIHRISDSKLSFKVGPLAVGEINFIDDLLSNFIYLVLGVVLLIWTVLFSYKLKRLEDATTSFGEGDLGVRAPEQKSLTVGNLNYRFNQMAGRIAGLIEEQRQLSRAISHELRAPISRIRCQIDLLEMAKTDFKRNQKIDGISEDLTELEDLVSELLYYAKLEYLQIDEKQSMELLSWLTEVIFTLQRETSIPIKLSCKPNFFCTLDQSMLARALNNLIRNAIQHADSLVYLNVVITLDKVVFHINDDGNGIPPSDRKRIFNPFVRLDKSRSRDTGGVGLGLAIVLRIVNQLNGKITVEDSLSLKGACFSLYLPKASSRTSSTF